MSAPAWNDDFGDFVEALRLESVEFVIVGAHAMAVHGVPRATGDLDILVRPTSANASDGLPFLGLSALITSKRAAARPEDLVDADLLEATLTK